MPAWLRQGTYTHGQAAEGPGSLAVCPSKGQQPSGSSQGLQVGRLAQC